MNSFVTPASPLLIPSLPALRRKLARARGSLSVLLAKFQQQLADDAAFRRENLYLGVLLGDEPMLEQARRQVLDDAATLAQRGQDDPAIEHHVWCVAPRAMRIATYHDWLRRAAMVTPAQSELVGRALLTFCREHVVNVMRARVPAADNQSWSMALTCAVVGLAVADIAPLRAWAIALHRFGLQRLLRVLSLLPRDGYLLEGSTYQSHVVSPLAMWTAALLGERYGPALLHRPVSRNGASLLDVLRVEPLLGSPGSLLLPWDHYGWQRKINLSPIAYLASTMNDAGDAANLLDDALAVWDRESHIAWGKDDRLWALIYWPEARQRQRRAAAEPLRAWVLPRTAAAIDHRPTGSRLAMCWDRSADCLQALGRMQMNPNHVMWEAHGQPVTADGLLASTKPLSRAQRRILLAAVGGQRAGLDARYGCLERWIEQVHPGLPMWANCVLPQGGETWFAIGARGQLVGQWASSAQQVVIADAKPFWAPRWKFKTIRRAVAMNAAGIAWIVDYCQGGAAQSYQWQMHLRRGGKIAGRTLGLALGDAGQVTLGWAPVDEADLVPMDGFPATWLEGSNLEPGCSRLCLRGRGRAVIFAVCLMPWAAPELEVTINAQGEPMAQWAGGMDVLHLPSDWTTQNSSDTEQEQATVSDLNQSPWLPVELRESDLRAQLQGSDPKQWRRTVEAMQTLTLRGDWTSLPQIHQLLSDPHQPYQVHAVAAWCLGRTAWSDTSLQLQRLAAAPEFNTAMRARFALEAIARGPGAAVSHGSPATDSSNTGRRTSRSKPHRRR